MVGPKDGRSPMKPAAVCEKEHALWIEELELDQRG